MNTFSRLIVVTDYGVRMEFGAAVLLLSMERGEDWGKGEGLYMPFKSMNPAVENEEVGHDEVVSCPRLGWGFQK